MATTVAVVMVVAKEVEVTVAAMVGVRAVAISEEEVEGTWAMATLAAVEALGARSGAVEVVEAAVAWEEGSWAAALLVVAAVLLGVQEALRAARGVTVEVPRGESHRATEGGAAVGKEELVTLGGSVVEMVGWGY